MTRFSAPGPERADADAGLAGQPPVGRREEGRGLLVARHDQLDLRVSERLDDVEVLLARHPEDLGDALVLQRRYQQVRALGHGLSFLLFVIDLR